MWKPLSISCPIHEVFDSGANESTAVSGSDAVVISSALQRGITAKNNNINIMKRVIIFIGSLNYKKRCKDSIFEKN